LPEQLSNVVDENVKHQAATFSSVVAVSSSVTLMPSLNFTPVSLVAVEPPPALLGGVEQLEAIASAAFFEPAPLVTSSVLGTPCRVAARSDALAPPP
jgi:hypothetical protein